MSLRLALAVLAATAGPGEGEWSPAEPPPPTAWARAGARPWRACDDIGRKAIAARLGAGTRGATDRLWRRRVEQCPGEPEVLMLAAQEEILEAARIGWVPQDGQRLDETVELHQERIARAVAWLDASIAEAQLRGTEPPIEAWYWRGYARAAMGDFSRAGKDLRQAAEVGDVARWRLERMGSVVALLEGDLDLALRRAHLAMLDSPPEDRLISRYIWALVLDRSGASASARSEFTRVRREPGHTTARQAVESFLPIHERLYLRALEHQAHGERSNAVRLWDLYLARPEPAEPDRELARRHKSEL